MMMMFTCIEFVGGLSTFFQHNYYYILRLFSLFKCGFLDVTSFIWLKCLACLSILVHRCQNLYIQEQNVFSLFM